MTAPTKKVRADTYRRDNWMCVAAKWDECAGPLNWNHREASGHGGRGKKAGKPTCADGVTLCESHNNRLESDLRETGLRLGWKILRNRGGIPSYSIPFYDRSSQQYYLPTGVGREPIREALALELLAAAGNLVREPS